MTGDDAERLQLRLDRERRARRQAEIIAERGMRELWQANSELQARVARRTADLELAARADRYREWARATLVVRSATAAVEQLDRLGASVSIDGLDEVRRRLQAIVRHTADAVPPAANPSTRELVDVADELIGTWQHVAARSGRLLTVEVSPGYDSVTVDWAATTAALDAALGGCVRHSMSGALVVTLGGSDEGARIRITGGTTIGDAEAGPAAAAVDERLAVAELVLEQIGGRLQVDVDTGASTVTLIVPTIDPS